MKATENYDRIDEYCFVLDQNSGSIAMSSHGWSNEGNESWGYQHERLVAATARPISICCNDGRQ